MEIESVNSKANAGLTTGIIGTAGVGLALLSHGLFNWGSNSVNASNTISRMEYEHNNEDIKTIAQKDSEIAQLKMNSLMDSKVLDLYKYVESKFHDIDGRFGEQGIWNATATGTFGTMGAQIASLQNTCNNLTKTVIPITNVCPQPMPLYNTWEAPTTTPGTTTA